MTCRGCGEEKKLIKAHIIPESFFVGMQSEGKSALLVADTLRYTKRSPTGIYDEGILCHDCEQRFQEIDDYGQKILLKDPIEQIKRDGEIVAYKIANVDYSLTKLFFISILWRASISTHVYYSKIDLGKLEAVAKEHVWNLNPGVPDEFSFVLAKFTDEKLGTAMLNPHRARFGPVNYSIFYLYGYILYIKVDKRDTPSLFGSIKLKEPNHGLFIVGRDISQSKELKIMYDIVIK